MTLKKKKKIEKIAPEANNNRRQQQIAVHSIFCDSINLWQAFICVYNMCIVYVCRLWLIVTFPFSASKRTNHDYFYHHFLSHSEALCLYLCIYLFVIFLLRFPCCFFLAVHCFASFHPLGFRLFSSVCTFFCSIL